jgi:uncharacterized protein with ATP-grasp and redox domains
MVVNTVALQLPKILSGTSPPEIGMIIYKTIYRISGNRDPYKNIKDKYTQHLLSMYQTFKTQINSSKDPLYTALKFAALGNAIDLGADHNFDLDKAIDSLNHQDFDVCEYSTFKKIVHRRQCW